MFGLLDAYASSTGLQHLVLSTPMCISLLPLATIPVIRPSKHDGC